MNGIIYGNSTTIMKIKSQQNDILQELTLLEASSDTVSEFVNMTFSPLSGFYEIIVDNSISKDIIYLIDNRIGHRLGLIK